MAAAESDADAIRKEVEVVKEQARAYIEKLNKEKNDLSKQLQEKANHLANVKERTKAYVDKLRTEQKTALAALEEQVKERDERLSRAKDHLQSSIAAKDEELGMAKREAQTLRDLTGQETTSANGVPEVNGIASPRDANVAVEVDDLKRRLQEGAGELKGAVEALSASEAARARAEATLEESKQAEAAVRERLAVVSRERTAAVMELDASRVLVDSLKVSLVQTQSIADAAQAEARDAREKAAAAIEGVQTEAASAAEAAAERHKSELRSMEERANQAAENAAAAAGKGTKNEAPSDAEAEIARLQEELRLAMERAETGESARSSASASVTSLQVELGSFKEQLPGASNIASAASASDGDVHVSEVWKASTSMSQEEMVVDVNVGDAPRKLEMEKTKPPGARANGPGGGEVDPNQSAVDTGELSQVEELLAKVAALEVKLAERDDLLTGIQEHHTDALDRVTEESVDSPGIIAVLEDKLAGSKRAVHEAEEASAASALAATSAREALRLAQEEVKMAREGAGNQAEELSARLMEALEEREEGKRREETAAREIAKLEAELDEVEEALAKAEEDAAAERAAAAAAAEAGFEELEAKVREAESRADEAEASAVGVVKSMQEALTQRDEDVKRLNDEAAGLRREVSIANAELEARGEALRQAKLDLASAVEEASSAGNRAADIRSKLEAAVAELGEVKMRLESESAANAGLKTAVLEANETVSKRVDGMREAIERTEAERDASRAEVVANKAQIQTLQAQLTSLLREHEDAKTEAGLRAGDLQERLIQVEATLGKERDTFAERKREMKVYADAMAKEGDAMRNAVNEAQTAVARARESELEAKSSLAQVNQRAEATVQSLRQSFDKHVTETAQKIGAVQQLNKSLEAENTRLEHLLALESDQREEKTQGLEHSLLDKIEEANLHKKKRLAARTEMITLAKTLEMERDGHKAVGHSLQYGLVPKAIEQATILEHVVMTAERSVQSLSRASGVRLATNLQAAQASFARLRGRVAGADDTGAALHQRQFPDLARMALMGGSSISGVPEDATGSVISDRLESPLGSAASSDQTGPGFWQAGGGLRGLPGRMGSGDQASTKDSVYMERVRRLESEMERVSSGLALVSQSVNQLAELVQVQAGLCAGFSVFCCKSRRSKGGSRSGRGGGPAYTTLEMGDRHESADDEGRDRGMSTGLIRR